MPMRGVVSVSVRGTVKSFYDGRCSPRHGTELAALHHCA